MPLPRQVDDCGTCKDVVLPASQAVTVSNSSAQDRSSLNLKLRHDTSTLHDRYAVAQLPTLLRHLDVAALKAQVEARPGMCQFRTSLNPSAPLGATSHRSE